MTGASVLMALAFVVSIAAPSAMAQTQNILVGQNMSIGSTGDGVVVLQGLLSEFGYLSVPSSVPFGYFGALTASALGRYQASLNITPTVGYFGPTTKIAMHDDFSPRGWLSLLGWYGGY